MRGPGRARRLGPGPGLVPNAVGVPVSLTDARLVRTLVASGPSAGPGTRDRAPAP